MKKLLSVLFYGSFLASVFSADFLPIGSETNVNTYLLSKTDSLLVNVFASPNDGRLAGDLSRPWDLWYIKGSNYSPATNSPLLGFIQSHLSIGIEKVVSEIESPTNWIYRVNWSARDSDSNTLFFTNNVFDVMSGGENPVIPTSSSNVFLNPASSFRINLPNLGWAQIVEKDISGNITNVLDTRLGNNPKFLVVNTNTLSLPTATAVNGGRGEVIVSYQDGHMETFDLSTGLRLSGEIRLTVLVSDQTHIAVSADPRSLIMLESSTNLVNWATLVSGMLVPPEGITSYTDTPPSSGPPTRFYRARYGP